MRFLQALALVTLPLTGLSALKVSDNRFEDYYSKAISSTPLKLDDASYDELTAAPRNYTVAVLLTALEAKFGCQLCRDFQPEWDLVGKNWVKGDRKGTTRVLYGTLDFADGKATFQKVHIPYQASVIVRLFEFIY